uniref:Uncharacterized protein n=1 Tax=Pithovirus LCPAC101 TaxID=2506586 RepID=A0A481Z2D4_9VIRU|nr:MAG: hypothetical protein LCPAC101_02000 [Pithovirus LCPAC101]
MDSIGYNDYIKMQSIAHNDIYLRKLTENTVGSWVLRISSMDKYAKSGKCKLVGLENANIVSILTISIHNSKNHVLSYRILCIINIDRRKLIYAVPDTKYNTKSGKVDGMRFTVSDLDVLSMELNPKPNMIYDNFGEILSHRLKLSDNKEIILDDICSSKILQTVSKVYSI